MSGFPDGVDLEHFVPSEFDHPDKVDPTLLGYVDATRDRCGFPVRINSDVRPANETAGPHAIHDDGWGHALDVGPAGALDAVEFHARKAEIFVAAFELGPRRLGVWKVQGLELGTQHVHIDNSPDLRRPHYWGAKSR